MPNLIRPPLQDSVALAAPRERGTGAMDIQTVLQQVQREGERHLLQPESPADLDVLEAELGFPLPAPFRLLLTVCGAGVLYERHEVFGARRVMIHDIELVPDALSVKRRLAAITALPPWLLPFHRFEDSIHLLDLSDGSVTPWGRRTPVYRDLTTFLAEVVVPAGPRV